MTITTKHLAPTDVTLPEMQTLMVTGHRPDRLGGYCETGLQQAIKRQVLNWLNHQIYDAWKDGYRYFLTGMAQGVDTWFAEAVMIYRASQHQTRSPERVRLIAVVPFEGQESRWPRQIQEHYRMLLAQCDLVTTLNPRTNDKDLARQYLMNRNDWMAYKARRVLAVWDGGLAGGTAAAVRISRKLGKDVRTFFPPLAQHKK